MSLESDNVLYILECKHVMPGNKASLGQTECYLCNEVKQITGVHVYEWHGVCKSCPWGKWTGLARSVASYYASVHVSRKPNHEAKVLYQPNPLGLTAEKRLRKAGVIA